MLSSFLAVLVVTEPENEFVEKFKNFKNKRKKRKQNWTMYF